MLKGWKSLLAGLSMMGLGAFLMATGDAEQGIARITEGIAIIGIAHKIEKAAK